MAATGWLGEADASPFEAFLVKRGIEDRFVRVAGETRDDVVAAARGLLEGETELVVVSMGAEGALFVTGRRVVAATPPAVAVRTTVGAGDAMVAGIVAGRVRGLELGELARLASAFALGALTGKPAGSWADSIAVRELEAP